MVVLPEVIMLRHVNTPKDVADILAWQCKVDIPESLLRATEVRRRAVVLLLQSVLLRGAVSKLPAGAPSVACCLPVQRMLRFRAQQQ